MYYAILYQIRPNIEAEPYILFYYAILSLTGPPTYAGQIFDFTPNIQNLFIVSVNCVFSSSAAYAARKNAFLIVWIVMDWLIGEGCHMYILPVIASETQLVVLLAQ